ncbi:hypothetical protein [Bifidobacterium sp. ESL0704]|uniref:hypothetical protein n=1 Tax=Bifidobacterium sp. ESL0704 TaxID=2983219 RepID=UPI0023F76BF0|nr:hypothetical protein [Bifidobacterium sp. ESL0704]WEV53074.1 hypothetical protein OZX64_00800 [Bifidobacterium sp. ESL0704]
MTLVSINTKTGVMTSISEIALAPFASGDHSKKLYFKNPGQKTIMVLDTNTGKSHIIFKTYKGTSNYIFSAAKDAPGLLIGTNKTIEVIGINNSKPFTPVTRENTHTVSATLSDDRTTLYTFNAMNDEDGSPSTLTMYYIKSGRQRSQELNIPHSILTSFPDIQDLYIDHQGTSLYVLFAAGGYGQGRAPERKKHHSSYGALVKVNLKAPTTPAAPTAFSAQKSPFGITAIAIISAAALLILVSSVIIIARRRRRHR